MSFNKQIPVSSVSGNQIQGFSTAKLKQFIEGEVFEILGGIKEEIEIKMKQVDRNIGLLKGELSQLKRVVGSTTRSRVSQDSTSIQQTFKLLAHKLDKVQKQLQLIKTSSNDSFSNPRDVQKSTTSTYKLNQSAVQKSLSAQRTNSPIIKKSGLLEMNALTFEDGGRMLGKQMFEEERQIVMRHNSGEVDNCSREIGREFVGNRLQKKTAIFANPVQSLKKPPLPGSDNKFNRTPNPQYSTSTSFYQALNPPYTTPTQPYSNPSRPNSIMNPLSQPSQQKVVEKQLSKNKSQFLRKKKSEQTLQNISQTQKQPETSSISNAFRFQNQLQEFDSKEDQSFNIELQYSKDTFLSDL